MLKYIFSILFIYVSVIANAQNKKTITDTINTTQPQRYGLRMGIDISKIAQTLYDKQYKGLELVADYRVSKKIYLATEIGTEFKKTNQTQLDFTTQGSYLKIGFDANTYQNWLDMENLIHIGVRYSTSAFSQELHQYKIYNKSNYFTPPPPVTLDQKYNNLSAHWIEVVTGIKAKVLPNIYAGFSVRVNYLLGNKQPENFANLYIPGFGRTYDGNFGASFNYTLSYFIPFYKSKPIIKINSKQ